MIRYLKKIIKDNPLLLRLYIRSKFIARLPLRDYFNPYKLNLLLSVEPYTMLPYSRMSKIYEVSLYLKESGGRGNFVECGVWNGGSAGIMASVSRFNENRYFWLFDSWEGLPEPGEYDVQCTGKRGEKGMASGSQEKVEKLLFRKLKLDRNKIHLIKGWFEQTIPLRRKEIGEIALLHLDCDWYESVKFCLNELFDNVVEGGFIFIDDYGEWQGCKRAVDEFFAERKLRIKLNHIDYAGVYFQK